MAKKLSLLMAAVAVLAFAIPAVASAGTVTSSAGVLAPVNTEITGTSTNAITTSSLGNITCEKVTLKGKITANSAGTVHAVGVGAGTTTKCFFKGSEIPITDVTLTTIHSAVAGSGTVSFSFIADLPGLTCTFTGTNVPGTYVVGSSKLTMTKGALKVTPAACGTATLDADFTLEIGATAVILD